MKIKVFSFYKILYQGDIISITAPGYYGYFQVLKNHAPFISILSNGFLKLKFKSEKNTVIQIKGGLLQVKQNMIIVIL